MRYQKWIIWNKIFKLFEIIKTFTETIMNYWWITLVYLWETRIYYESFIKDTNSVNVISNYHKNKLYEKIFNSETNFSNFLLFMNPTHKMEVEFNNDNTIKDDIMQ